MHFRHQPQAVFALMVAATVAQPVRGAASDPVGNYPNRPIRFILANGPGSNADIFTRILAQKLGEALGQKVVVDSRPGAGGMLGIDIAAKSTPDGYTIARGNLPTLAIAPHVYSSSWAGVVVPKGTPQAIISKLNAAIVRVLSTSDVKEQFLAQGAEASPTTPQEFARFIRLDYDRIAKVAKIAGLKAE